MTDHIETVIAETIWVLDHDEPWSSLAPTFRASCLAEATAILDALKAARIAVVELPEPYREGSEPEWSDGDVWACPGSGRVRIYVQDSRFEANEAREFAADILAAADAAEASQ